MAPVLDPATYVFCRLGEGLSTDRLTARGIFHEREGVTLILEEAEAGRAGLAVAFVARRIELTVHSDLDAVGFLARVAGELAAAGIPSNVVSALHHDHLYVPVDLAERALAVLTHLEREAREDRSALTYAVTVRIDRSLAEEWLEWMRRVHVPQILATGCFRRCTVERQDPEPEEARAAFLLLYQARSPEALERYRASHAPALQRSHSARYAGRFEVSREIREVAFEIPGALA